MEAQPIKIEGKPRVFEAKKLIGSQYEYNFFVRRSGNQAYILTVKNDKVLDYVDFDDGGANCPNEKNKNLMREQIEEMKNAGVDKVIWVGGYIDESSKKETGIDRVATQEEKLELTQEYIEQARDLRPSSLTIEMENSNKEIIINLIKDKRYADAEAFCRIKNINIQELI